MDSVDVDVATVGTELSGLRLTDRLRSSEKSVLLLETKDRIGGQASKKGAEEVLGVAL
jgi:UDP-galactopyranose mutase